MSRIHAWRTGSKRLAILTGSTILLAGAASTVAIATHRQPIPDPVVLAESLHAALPTITDDKRLVNISPQLAPDPEAFDGKGVANWDGRRTLRGVWVAHPMAQTARRVRIYNLENGAVVDGALFKRDASDGKKGIIVSSDAAERLGLEPNAPTTLRILAVRPTEKDEPNEKSVKTWTGERKTGEATKTTGNSEDVVNDDTVADKPTPTATKTVVEDGPTKPAKPDDPVKLALDDTRTVLPTLSDEIDPIAKIERDPDAPPIPLARPTGDGIKGDVALTLNRAEAGFKFVPDGNAKTRFSADDSYFKRTPKEEARSVPRGSDRKPIKLAMVTEAEKTSPSDGESGDIAGFVIGAIAPVKPASEPPVDQARTAATRKDVEKPAAPTADKTSPTFKTAPTSEPLVKIKAPSLERIPATTEAEPTVNARKAGDASVAKAEPIRIKKQKLAAKETRKEPAPKTLTKAYVQAGFFSVKSNATKLVAKLKSKGIPAFTKPMTAGGKDFSRVLAGPFADSSSLEKAQRRIHAMGLSDAMPVKR